ncbi:MAG: chloride channel protein [Candidatus Nanopelagicales bacterium]|nr:chloride channel protein [Candidatus Nanopelagicales bacterium]MDZ4249406.1 chloride channel protein [Candidatus Nanopelagicales bacterium]
MTQTPEEPLPPVPDDPTAPGRGLVVLAVAAAAAGAITGLLGAAFRWTLMRADEARIESVEFLHGTPWAGTLMIITAAGIAVALARLIVRWVPAASGSGVQRVEGEVRDQLPLEHKRVIPAKFVGGVLSMGAGMALGREGPTVQMGAAVGSNVGKLARLGRAANTDLGAAMAGAGLAVAFNAPTGGAIFVFEELTRAFRVRLVAATIIGTACAIFVSRGILGDSPEFTLASAPGISLGEIAAYSLFGLMLGLIGAAYNKTVIWSLDQMTRVPKLSFEAKAAVVGGIVGAVGWFAPTLAGEGALISQQMLTAAPPLAVVLVILAVRWILGPLSYSVGTPGGLFAPLLALGATCGALFAMVVNLAVPSLALPTAAFALVGMSTMFAAVVRAPLTGVVIVAEMAATTNLLPAALLAAAVAVIAATLVRSEPIYDSLRHRSIAQDERG